MVSTLLGRLIFVSVTECLNLYNLEEHTSRWLFSLHFIHILKTTWISNITDASNDNFILVFSNACVHCGYMLHIKLF